MGLTAEGLIHRLRRGLPLVERPYAAIADELGATEAEVLEALAALAASGTIGRFGVIVDHGTLGFTANAMVVWNVPADRIDAAGARLGRCPGVSLCYSRRPSPPDWPYSLYTMIHGRSRGEVTRRVEAIAADCGLTGVGRELLFTIRRFKQTAAYYGRGEGRHDR